MDRCLFRERSFILANPNLIGPNSEDKLWAGLSYAGIGCGIVLTVLIFIFKQGESDFIKFHALQAILGGIAAAVLGGILLYLSKIPFLGFLISILGFFIGLILFGFWVYLMIAGFTGRHFKIPLLGDFIEKSLMN